MSEEFDSLEAELARMRPCVLTPELAARIAAPLLLPPRRSRSDRLIWCAIGSGVIAACTIAVLLLGQPASSGLPPSVMASGSIPRVGDLTVSSARQQDQLASAWK
jgi:hypothetical protein